MAQKKRSIFQSAPVPAGPAAAAPVEALVLAGDAATALKQLAKHRLRAPGDAQGYVLAAALQLFLEFLAGQGVHLRGPHGQRLFDDGV